MAASRNSGKLRPWTIRAGDSPVVAAAIHDGHELRTEVAASVALPEADRLREEDPYTGAWTEVAETQLVVHRSRFEVDLNRPRDKAVYLTPEDAWGLHVWTDAPPGEMVARSLEQYDTFYREVHGLLSELQRRHGRFVVVDLHSYNHRREGPDGPPADPEGNPEVNVGTGSLDRERWAPVVDRFLDDLRTHGFLGRQLDVRENVKFRGGQFSRWVHEQFPESGCALAIEFKKFFMDEWTGEPYAEQLEAIRDALAVTIPGLESVLGGQDVTA